MMTTNNPCVPLGVYTIAYADTNQDNAIVYMSEVIFYKETTARKYLLQLQMNTSPYSNIRPALLEKQWSPQ